jgi:hypothetical protein
MSPKFYESLLYLNLHFLGKKPQVLPDIIRDPIHIMNQEQIEGLKSAAKIAAATLKHALENTKVSFCLSKSECESE